MKRRFFLIQAISLASLSAHAQFVTSGGNTTTSNNVGVGTASPAFKLSVAGTTPSTRTVAINATPVFYFPVEGSNGIAGSLALGNGLRLQELWGNSNTVVGRDAGLSLEQGFTNTATGSNALRMATDGSANSAYGNYVLMNAVNTDSESVSSVYNAVFGYASMLYNTVGGTNSAAGALALMANTSGAVNTAGGYLAMQNNTTGYWNVALGSSALYNNTTGNFNMALGTSADVLDGNLSNAAAIGAFALVGKSNAIVLGDTTKPTQVGIGTAYPGYMLDVRASVNPVRLRGLQAGNLVSDYLVTADANGVLRRIPVSSIGGGGSSVNAGQGLTFDGGTMMLGDYCGNGGGQFEQSHEINMNNFDLYFNTNELAKIYMGPSYCQPLTTRLEITAHGLGNEINEYDVSRPSLSGLRFTDLTAKSELIENMYRGVLSLDEDGDVIWVQDCCNAAKGATQYEEVKNAADDLEAEIEMLKNMLQSQNTASADQ